MTPPKKRCLRCDRPRHHSDHNLGVCEWLTPATNALQRQREEGRERRLLVELHKAVLRRDGGCVLRLELAPDNPRPCGYFGGSIQYHHRLTRGRAGRSIDTLDNLAAICPGHHGWLHDTGEGQVYGRENDLLLHAYDEEAVSA